MKPAFEIYKDTFANGRPLNAEADTIAEIHKIKQEGKKMGENAELNSDESQEKEATPKPPEKTTTSDSALSVAPEREPFREPSRIQASDGRLSLSPKELETILTQRAGQLTDHHKAELQILQDALSKKDEEIVKIRESIDKIEQKHEQEIQAKNKEISDWTRIFVDTGGSLNIAPSALNPNHSSSDYSQPISPYSSQQFLTNSQKTLSASDAWRECCRILENKQESPWYDAFNPQTGETYRAKDTRSLQRFIRSNRDSVIAGLEAIAKKSGFLRGRLYSSDAPTTKASLPPLFLETLSTLVRDSHRQDLVFHQFAQTEVASGYNIGDTFQIPRIEYFNESLNPDDYELDPAVRIVDESIDIRAGHVKAEMKEYGRGKNAALAPVAIPQFISATSMMDVIQYVQRNLRYSYNLFEDLKIRRLYGATTRTVYNDNNAVTADLADVAAGDNGTLTRAFLTSLYAEMFAAQIPTFEGHFVLVTHPRGLAQLMESIQENSRYMSKQSMEDMTNLVNRSTGQELGKVDGYQFSVSNFHVYVSNAFSSGVAGTEGTQTETLGAGAVTTRTSYAFGAGAVGRGIAMPFNLKSSNDDDFGRLMRYIWCSIETFAPLDVDPASVPGSDQQLRVFKVNTTDVAV